MKHQNNNSIRGEPRSAETTTSLDWLERNASKIVLGIGFAALVIGVAVISIYVGYFHSNGVSLDPTDWAPFGNYIGGTLGTVYAFLALAVLLLSLEVQRRELKATRVELEKSYWQAKRHNFENTFFKLLELHQLRVNSLSMSEPEYNLSAVGVGVVGTSKSTVFKALWGGYIRPLLQNTAFSDHNNHERHRRLLDFTEERFTNVVESYCNNLKETFSIISSWHEKDTAQRYLRILQSQMTGDELRCLFAFACSDRYGEMKEAIEEFSFFQSKTMFEIPEQCLHLYDSKAYGDLATKLMK